MAKGFYNKAEDINFLISFIQQIEKQPCLWNYQLKDYGKSDITASAWKSIAAEIKDTEQNCRERWRNIRCAFVRSLRPPKPGGQSKKTYYLAKYLSFLIPYMKSLSRNSSVTSTEVECVFLDSDQIDALTEGISPISNTGDEEQQQQQHDETFLEKPVQTKKFHKVSRHCDVPVDWVKLKKQKQSFDEDADLLFFRSVLPDLKKLDDRRKRDLKAKFISMLNSALDDAEQHHEQRSFTPYSIASTASNSSCAPPDINNLVIPHNDTDVKPTDIWYG